MEQRVVKNQLFRFQTMDIWKRASKISMPLFQIADKLEKEKKFRFAEQLRGATLSITNNIAEGSGSTSSKDFQNFLKFSRRSVFEVANILMILVNAEHININDVGKHLIELDEISKMIVGFSKSLNT
ncbi:MAG: four helix bundle protein [Candidatus Marinimicrobia bacterium]|nr:four helix bundle protein [Candidatus Neomarinimicrobiota bacterium]